MLKNPSIKNLINSCIVARYKVNPAPKNLSQSLEIYSNFSNLIKSLYKTSSTSASTLPSIVQYKQDKCPVTKKYLEDLRLVLYDPSKDGNSSNLSPDGSIITPNNPRSTLLKDQISALTPLEQLLINIDNCEIDENTKFSLDLTFLSRNPEAVSMSSNVYTTTQLGTLQQSKNLNEAVNKADLQFETKLNGLIKLFENKSV